MAGLDPAIHDFLAHRAENVDARVKPGHDDRIGLAHVNFSKNPVRSSVT